jgi:hypothetical protein
MHIRTQLGAFSVKVQRISVLWYGLHLCDLVISCLDLSQIQSVLLSFSYLIFFAFISYFFLTDPVLIYRQAVTRLLVTHYRSVDISRQWHYIRIQLLNCWYNIRKALKECADIEGCILLNVSYYICKNSLHLYLLIHFAKCLIVFVWIFYIYICWYIFSKCIILLYLYEFFTFISADLWFHSVVPALHMLLSSDYANYKL